MTIVQERPAEVLEVATPPPLTVSTALRRLAPRRRPRQPAPASGGALSSVLTALGILLLGFLLSLSLLGSLRHSRDQQTAYQGLRDTLAKATTPVGQTTFTGTLVPLGTPIALLRIPQIGLQQVVLEGTTAGVTRSGPGHRRDTPLPGQPGASYIVGRRAGYGGPFHGLARLRPGQEFTVTTGQGEQRFRVVDVRRAGDVVPPPSPSGSRLVLVTATGAPYLPDGVLRVDADLVSTVQPAPTRAFGIGSLPRQEKDLQGDDTALVALMLWAQAFFLVTVGVVLVRARWGRPQVWLVAAPLLAYVGLHVADEVARLLPNLL